MLQQVVELTKKKWDEKNETEIKWNKMKQALESQYIVQNDAIHYPLMQ